MRVIQPLTRTFRRQLKYGAIIYPALNWMLRRIAYLYGRLQCLLNCEGNAVEVTKTVSSVFSIIRVVDPMAKETYIWNEGSQLATVLENNVIVARVQPGTRQKLPVSGKLILSALTETGLTTLRVVTIQRCLCGDEFSPYDSGVVTPTGMDLI